VRPVGVDRDALEAREQQAYESDVFGGLHKS
jgi:hypothetical protein